MGKPILRVECDGVPYYMEWSTIVDAPITYGMARDEFREHIREEYGQAALADLDARLARADATGTSMIEPRRTGAELIRGNRAGPDESEIGMAEIVELYVRRRPGDHDED